MSDLRQYSLFDLYGLVQQKDKSAVNELLRRHKLKFPKKSIHKEPKYLADERSRLGAEKFYHMLYLQLYR